MTTPKAETPETAGKVIDLMVALKESLGIRDELAARSPAPSDGTQNIPMPSAERCRDFNLPASIGATTIPASMLVRNTSDRVEIPAAPSVEARETLLGYPLRVDSSIPADELRFIANGQIVGVIRLAPASLLPPETP